MTLAVEGELAAWMKKNDGLMTPEQRKNREEVLALMGKMSLWLGLRGVPLDKLFEAAYVAWNANKEAVAAEREACVEAVRKCQFERQTDNPISLVHNIVVAIQARGVAPDQRTQTRMWTAPPAAGEIRFFDSFAQDLGVLKPSESPGLAVASNREQVRTKWARATRLEGSQRGWAEVRFRVGGGDWQTRMGQITAADPTLPLYLDVVADFSRLFDAAGDPADLRDSASKPDDVDYQADHFGDLGAIEWIRLQKREWGERVRNHQPHPKRIVVPRALYEQLLDWTHANHDRLGPDIYSRDGVLTLQRMVIVPDDERSQVDLGGQG